MASVHFKAVDQLLFIYSSQLLPLPFCWEGDRVWSLFSKLVLKVHSSFAIILQWNGEQSELPRPIPWNQTSDVHRGSSLIT